MRSSQEGGIQSWFSKTDPKVEALLASLGIVDGCVWKHWFQQFIAEPGSSSEAFHSG